MPWLDKITRKYWWSGKSDQKKLLALRSWEKIYQHKDFGGLDFRNFEDINQALMTKIGWRVALDSKLMWVKVLRQKYCASRDYFEVSKRRKDFFGLAETKDVIKKNSTFAIGSSQRV